MIGLDARRGKTTRRGLGTSVDDEPRPRMMSTGRAYTRGTIPKIRPRDETVAARLRIRFSIFFLLTNTTLSVFHSFLFFHFESSEFDGQSMGRSSVGYGDGFLKGFRL